MYELFEVKTFVLRGEETRLFESEKGTEVVASKFVSCRRRSMSAFSKALRRIWDSLVPEAAGNTAMIVTILKNNYHSVNYVVSHAR